MNRQTKHTSCNAYRFNKINSIETVGGDTFNSYYISYHYFKYFKHLPKIQQKSTVKLSSIVHIL